MKVVLIAAITVDGFIGKTADHLADWTGGADKKLFVQVTKEAGAIVMGSTTFATIGRALPGRRMIVYTTKPKKITAGGVETTNEPPAKLIARLTKEGAHGLAVCGGATIYTQFMAAGVVDELYITVAPTVFGTGIPLFTTNEDIAQNLELIEQSLLDENTILLHYKTI
nr:Dihydrofolate reductase [uncultured bacterium]